MENQMEKIEVTIDLLKCLNRNFFLRTMRNEFSFPSYFGENMDAVDECMRDLSWIKEKKIQINIKNSKKALKENADASQKIIKMFESYSVFWKNEKEDRKEFKVLIIS